MLCTSCSKTVRPVVALDIDGTLAKYHQAFVEFLELYFGRSFPGNWDGRGNWENYLGIERTQYQDAKLAFRQGGFHRWMLAHQGIDDVINAIRQSHAELWVTTTRPYLRLDAVDPDTQEWLLRNSVPFDHLLYDDEKYRKLAQQVSSDRVVLVLEDLPLQYENAAVELGHDIPLLVERMHNLYYREKQRSLSPYHRMRTTRSLHEAASEISFRVKMWDEEHA